MRRASRSFLAGAISALVVAQGAGCAVEERPADAVKAYFHGLASDAVATLLVTSPRFQAQHGLRVTQAQALEPAKGTQPVELATGDESPEAAAQTEVPQAADVDASSPAEIARAQLGWIVLVKLRSFREQAAALAVEIVQVDHTDDHAIVTTRVTPRGASPFTQRFFLTRKDRTGRWWIDSIEQEDVKLGSRRAAFTAAPTESVRRRILPPGSR